MNVGDNENNTAVFVCEHVFNRERIVIFADYDDEGIQAVCDLDHSGSDIKIISLEELLSLGTDLEGLKNLPINHAATRQADGTWKFEALQN